MEVADTAPLTYPYCYAIESSDSNIDKLRARIAPFRFHLATRSICQELAIKPEDKVLEVGSGLGILGNEIKKLTGALFNFIGIDICADSVSQSQNLITSIRADAVNLPFAGNSFSKIISTDVFEHITNAPKTAQEIFRVLKPGGMAFIVIADPSEARFSKVNDHIMRSTGKTDVDWWDKVFQDCGFLLLKEASQKYRQKDWRKIFKLPFLARLKNKPLFACAFNPVCRPGVYILKKPFSLN